MSAIEEGVPDSFSKYRTKRDYRALLFSCDGLKTVNEVAKLFDGIVLSKKEQRHLPSLGMSGVVGARVRYRSKKFFVRGDSPEKRQNLRAGEEGDIYEYEVCVFAYGKFEQPLFMVAVPFSSMARELFGKIHKKKPNSTFKYFRPSLERMLRLLVQEERSMSNVRATGINWSIAGDSGRSDQITLRGADLVHSRAFEYLVNLDDLAIGVRKIQIVYEGFGGTEKLKLTFDKFGNHGVWVTGEGKNLGEVFAVYEVLRKSKLIEEDTAFPVRNREDEPLLP